MKTLSANLLYVVAGVFLGTIAMSYYKDREAPRPSAQPKTATTDARGATAGVASASQAPSGKVANGGDAATPQPPAAADDAAVRRAIAESKVEKLHGHFLKHLAAKGGNATKFRAMLTERQMITSDMMAAGRAQGIDLMNRDASKPLMDLMRRSMIDFNAQMRTEVGEADYGSWVQWERMKPDHTITKELSRRLDGTPFAMSAEQQERFAHGLHECKDAAGRRTTINLPDFEGVPLPTRLIPETALERVRALLSPQQFEKLNELYREQQRNPASRQALPW